MFVLPGQASRVGGLNLRILILLTSLIDTVRDFNANGVPVRLYRPASETQLPLLVFLHGGGWMLGDLETHDAMHRHLAARASCAVLAVGYRLAPEHPFPAGLVDAATAFAWASPPAATLASG